MPQEHGPSQRSATTARGSFDVLTSGQRSLSTSSVVHHSWRHSMTWWFPATQNVFHHVFWESHFLAWSRSSLMRPCTCDRCEVGKPYEAGQCRLCWLYHHDASYRALWGGEPLPGPSLLRKVANFAGAIVQHVHHGLPMVSSEEKERRLAICRSCEHHLPAQNSCRLCGCNLSTKAGWAEQQCPATPPKWGPSREAHRLSGG